MEHPHDLPIRPKTHRQIALTSASGVASKPFDLTIRTRRNAITHQGVTSAPNPVAAEKCEPTARQHDTPSSHTVSSSAEAQISQRGSLFVPSIDAKASRAYNGNGLKDKTMCFSPIFSHHPHHHLLACGHTVVTHGIEPCSRTCQAYDHNTGQFSDQKIETDTTDFLCPHPWCQSKRAKIADFFNLRTIIPTRPCLLSHVYGWSETADKAFTRDKKDIHHLFVPNPQIDQLEHTTRSRRRSSIRARSRSPARDDGGAALERERSSYRDRRVREPHAKYYPVYRTSVKTQAQIEQDLEILSTARVAQELAKLHVADTEALRSKQKLADPVASTILGDVLSSRDENADLDSYLHDKHLQRGQPSAATTGRYEVFKRHCVCQSFDDGYMLQCGVCQRLYHKGCIDQGKYTRASYETGDVDFRKACFEIDIKEHITSGVAFLCHLCMRTALRNGSSSDWGLHILTDDQRFQQSQNLENSRIAAAARVEMEKAYNVHPLQPRDRDDSEASRQERTRAAHEAAVQFTRLSLGESTSHGILTKAQEQKLREG